MRKWFLTLALVATVSGLGAGAARAALVTSSAGFPPPVFVVDFSQFGPGYGFTFGPVQVGGLIGQNIIFTAAPGGGGNSGLGSVLGSGSYGLGSNGSWGGAQTYAGLDSNSGFMTFTFANPVSDVGGFINYLPDQGFGPAFIEVLATDGTTVLEIYNLNALAPISTPAGFNAGAFRGISRPSPDIGGFRLIGAYIVIDDLTFSRAPEPASLAIFGVIGLAGVGYAWRRRRANV